MHAVVVQCNNFLPKKPHLLGSTSLHYSSAVRFEIVSVVCSFTQSISVLSIGAFPLQCTPAGPIHRVPDRISEGGTTADHACHISAAPSRELPLQNVISAQHKTRIRENPKRHQQCPGGRPALHVFKCGAGVAPFGPRRVGGTDPPGGTGARPGRRTRPRDQCRVRQCVMAPWTARNGPAPADWTLRPGAPLQSRPNPVSLCERCSSPRCGSGGVSWPGRYKPLRPPAPPPVRTHGPVKARRPRVTVIFWGPPFLWSACVARMSPCSLSLTHHSPVLGVLMQQGTRPDSPDRTNKGGPRAYGRGGVAALNRVECTVTKAVGPVCVGTPGVWGQSGSSGWPIGTAAGPLRGTCAIEGPVPTVVPTGHWTCRLYYLCLGLLSEQPRGGGGGDRGVHRGRGAYSIR